MPSETKYFMNDAQDPVKDFVRGRVISESKTKWKKSQDVWLPSELVLFRREKDSDIKHTYDCQFEWTANFKSDILFDDKEMRKRWDTIESLRFELSGS